MRKDTSILVLYVNKWNFVPFLWGSDEQQGVKPCFKKQSAFGPKAGKKRRIWPCSLKPYALLWLVVELPEYQNRGGDKDLIRRYRPHIGKLFDYFRQFENEYGLMEDLGDWIY